MRRKLIVLMAVLFSFSLSFVAFTGCAKKKAEKKTEQVKKSPADTTQSAPAGTTQTTADTAQAK